MVYDERDIEMLRANRDEVQHNLMLAEFCASDCKKEFMKARYALTNCFLRRGAEAQKSIKAVLNLPKKYQDGAYHTRFDALEKEERELNQKFNEALSSYVLAVEEVGRLRERVANVVRTLSLVEAECGRIRRQAPDDDEEKE